jgi:hypothetical protein
VVAEARLEADAERGPFPLPEAALQLEHDVVPVTSHEHAHVERLVLQQGEALARLELPLLRPAVEGRDGRGLEQRVVVRVTTALVAGLDPQDSPKWVATESSEYFVSLFSAS